MNETIKLLILGKREIDLEKFIIRKEVQKKSSVTRTIRMKAETFQKLMELSEEYNLSFNKISNQCLDYALKHLK